MKSLKQSVRSMAVVVAAVFLMAAVFMIPVPNANAVAPESAASASRETGLNGRYILSATVTRKGIVTGEDLDGNLITLMFVTFTDTEGENWVYGYELNEKTPPMNQQVILIMNVNGTPDDTDDDMIEDILYADPECTTVED